MICPTGLEINSKTLWISSGFSDFFFLRGVGEGLGVWNPPSFRDLKTDGLFLGRTKAACLWTSCRGCRFQFFHWVRLGKVEGWAEQKGSPRKRLQYVSWKPPVSRCNLKQWNCTKIPNTSSIVCTWTGKTFGMNILRPLSQVRETFLRLYWINLYRNNW